MSFSQTVTSHFLGSELDGKKPIELKGLGFFNGARIRGARVVSIFFMGQWETRAHQPHNQSSHKIAAQDNIRPLSQNYYSMLPFDKAISHEASTFPLGTGCSSASSHLESPAGCGLMRLITTIQPSLDSSTYPFLEYTVLMHIESHSLDNVVHLKLVTRS